MPKFPRTIRTTAFLVAIIVTALTVVSPPTLSSSQAPKPPQQPENGPGGKQYAHRVVTKNRYGAGGKEYWLFEPNAPKPKSAPVIVLMHGWGGVNPMYYGAWIEHLVKRGNVVIYPRYQSSLLTAVQEFTPNTMQALDDAFRRLQKERGHVRPDLKRFAVVGHSIGGLLAANIAALSRDFGLPRVTAVMSVEPGITASPVNFQLADLEKIASETLLLAVVGDQDGLVGDRDAKRIYVESRKVPAANKDFITLISDNRGVPALRAGHRAPTASNASYDTKENTEELARRVGSLLSRRSRRTAPESPTTDAMDFYGTWKLFDGLCDAAFFGKNREYALGNTPQQRFMGKWSDDVPVKELKVGVAK
ncbi:MAG TPA: alpha/beta hydrolase [Pyrinomonadaceae bacterium]|nr:alpha/beta hydrolase [Pyrinomonadaceae bacterium]